MTTDFTTTVDPTTSLPLKYECTSVMEGDAGVNRIGSTPVQFYYDLAWDPSEYDSVEDASRVLQSNLAMLAAEEYEIIPNGIACMDPPRDKDLWLVGVNAMEPDVPNTDLDDASACQELVDYPSNYNCHFMTGTMAFSIVGPKTTLELVHFVKDQYRSTQVTFGSKLSMRAKFVATQIDTSAYQGNGRDELPTQISSVQEEVQAPVAEDEDITIEGGFFVAGLVVVSALFATVMFRRFRRRRNAALAKEVDAILEAEQDDDDNDKGHARDSTFDLEHSMDATSDEDDDADLGVGRYDIEEDEDMVILPQRQYSFDMGGVMKNELLGVYGDSEVRATGITTTPSDAESEDVDSWAQTEGSIGSIELHLEPITAEV
eukprot:CAMPEP_0195284802 /NCGR_PEP_ID=MMETSP0707-20130614/2878_1 /TAXON_ID=33640 /ORGANISM="Asterionellopsis glacialis, Strain CCMP134" /LENGTH=373 /DNA_ID=CAMNT_0040344201 /DNA_START=34 /DNA_END=1155 /DNA_ORIENTATION=+